MDTHHYHHPDFRWKAGGSPVFVTLSSVLLIPNIPTSGHKNR